MIDDSANIAHWSGARDNALPRSARWLIVLVIHALFLTIFYFVNPPLPRLPLVEGESMLLLAPTAQASKTPALASQSAGPRPVPVLRAPPIVIIPPIVLSPPQQTTEDILRAIGDALSCGASSYENLSEYGRLNCRYIPWAPIRMPDGIIVLDAPLPPPRGVIDRNGAEAVRHEMQTAPACPMLENVPCLGNMVSGEGREFGH